jgi:hypothetical protein
MAKRRRIEYKRLRFYRPDELMPVVITPSGRVYIGTDPPIITEAEEDEVDGGTGER